jgi:hypothetical protein
MSQTVRRHLPAFRGRATFNHNWNAINAESVVVVTASEYRAKGQPLFVGESEPRFLGAAPVRVENIAPHGPPTDPNQGVGFAVVVDWPSPLSIVVDITVLDTQIVDVHYDAGSVQN